MGPLFFRAENSGAECSGGNRAVRPSMGPLFFRAENRPGSVASSQVPIPSMGPLFFRAENSQYDRCNPGPPSDPSMGPLFFRAENPPTPPATQLRTGLQWGRSFSERRTVGRRRLPRPPGTRLQWGRSFSERRTPTVDDDSGLPCVPSMGPLFFRAENTGGGLVPASGLAGPSMGPLFFRAENHAAEDVHHASHVLQWGRSFSERRTSSAESGVRDA